MFNIIVGRGKEENVRQLSLEFECDKEKRWKIARQACFSDLTGKWKGGLAKVKDNDNQSPRNKSQRVKRKKPLKGGGLKEHGQRKESCMTIGFSGGGCHTPTPKEGVSAKTLGLKINNRPRAKRKRVQIALKEKKDKHQKTLSPGWELKFLNQKKGKIRSTDNYQTETRLSDGDTHGCTTGIETQKAI